VVDTGIQAKRWTRQQAIDCGIDAREVERYVVVPGQACSHMIGYRQFWLAKRPAATWLSVVYESNLVWIAALARLAAIVCMSESTLLKSEAIAWENQLSLLLTMNQRFSIPSSGISGNITAPTTAL